jgi:hypothetical protein
MVAVTARISGRDLGSAIADVKQVLAQPGPGVSSVAVHVREFPGRAVDHADRASGRFGSLHRLVD